MSFIKQISLIPENEEKIIGHILYERIPSEEYQLKKQKFDDEEDFFRIMKLVNGYPSQEDFPNDEIDNIILEGIKDQFPNSKLINHAIIYKSHEEWVNKMRERPFDVSRINIQPQIKSSDYQKLSGKHIKDIVFDLRIYKERTSQLTQNRTFHSKYEIEKDEVIREKFRSTKFL